MIEMNRLVSIAIVVASIGIIIIVEGFAPAARRSWLPGLTVAHAEGAPPHSPGSAVIQNWKLEKIMKRVDLGDGKGLWSTYEAMVGEDGTRIQSGEGEAKSRNLLYKYRDDSVKVRASRYLADGRNMVDVWQVSFGLIIERLRPEYDARPGDFDIIAKIASSIRQVLPIWPYGDEEKLRPANEVRIGTGGFDSRGRHFRIDIDSIISHPERYSAFISDRIQTIYLLQR
jgi:hypothetical protein